ncbi:MAG: hypothetical protein WA952_14090 [Lewinella sp.]
MRIVLLLLLFIPGVAQACDCLGIHIPLEDALCQADTSGILVMEIRLVRQLDGNAAEVTVEDVFIGETDQRRLTLSAIHSCMWYIGNEPVGQRFLYFYRPDPRSAGQGDLFECGFNANIYRIDDSGQQLEYSYTNGGHDGINAGLRYRPFRHML